MIEAAKRFSTNIVVQRDLKANSRHNAVTVVIGQFGHGKI